ncbi:hypothetical protein BDY19DRAFT_95815 [Irpex rosettiformis]|uniref:Uncharacterized protein n=1 Tax=Irpex rosettiformis TaxID=378272 RepID=A0ACB8U6S6_9APHY|nr:hypothetical protein BDY19DRAFT_95815 [Irpex rosettiformis]
MSRVQIFAVGSHGKSIAKGSEDVNGILFGASGVKHVSLIITINELNPEHWNIVPAGDSRDLFYIQHTDSGKWAFAPENPHEGSFVLATSAISRRSVWRIKIHNGDEKSIHLRDNERLLWGIESIHAESEVKLKTGETDEMNRWKFERKV